MADPISAVASYGPVIVQWVLLIFGGLLGLGAIWFTTFMFMRMKQYSKYKVLIFKRKYDEAGNEYPVFVGADKAAVKYDKKWKRWVFHMAANKIALGQEEGEDENRELSVPSIPSERGGEIVFVEKLGPRKFAVADPLMLEGKVKLKVSEADVAEALRTYDVNAKMFAQKRTDVWMLVSIVIVAGFILIMVALVLNKFEVLNEVSKRLETVAQLLQAGRQAAVPSGAPG